MIYKGEYTKEISFPLGGIGTGSIGLAGNGRLIDWEIFNRPAKGSINGYSHIAVKAVTKERTYIKILNSDLEKDFTGQYSKINFTGFGFGAAEKSMCGFPHFKNCVFCGEFPIAKLTFWDDDFPGKVILTAFNPFIPLDSFNSSLPAAFFDITFENNTADNIEFYVIFSLENPYEVSENKLTEKDGISSVVLYNSGKGKDETEYGELALSCNGECSVQKYWYRGRWQDKIVSFWNELSGSNELVQRNYESTGKNDICSIMKKSFADKGASVSERFVLSWYVPNNYNYWNPCTYENGRHKTWKNYYATVFESADEVGRYSVKGFDELYKKTLEFKDELFDSSVHDCIKDAVSATISVLKSPTVLRLENGEFYGFEGVHEEEGSCEGTCQHVWNYAYALCFLFPELERSIRDLEFKYSTFESGEMRFRLPLPLGRKQEKFRACVDGQMGAVIKTYREWKISGDNEWLKSVWGIIEKIMDFAWSKENEDEWDKDKDGVLEGRQHHTLDMELFGPSSWLQGFYLAALKAASEMAGFLGYREKCEEYLKIFEKGKKWTRENLFNGEYFIHKIDIKDKGIVDHFNCSDVYWNDETKEIKYQIAEGSEIDQLCGQWHANICGLGEIFDKGQVHTALCSMMKNNFKESMRNFANPWRIFALNDESGTVMCDYPEGVYKPKHPIAYCEETMHGFEYQFAGLLFSEGMIDDGIKVVSAVRDRYDGAKRNPWNEIECGSNYARSMASFAILPILSGFIFDLPKGKIGFNPKIKKDKFKCIWSLGTGWGNVEITEAVTRINIIAGGLKLKSLALPYMKNVSSVIIDGALKSFDFKDGNIYFEKTDIINKIEVYSGK